MDFVDHPVSEEDERKLKNLATRIMSNGVEVLVKDKNSDSGKLEQTKFMEVKTIQPSAAQNVFQSGIPKIDKRIDSSEHMEHANFDLIQPSEVGHAPCTSSCSCSHTKTESLKTKYGAEMSNFKKVPMKSSKYGATKIDVRPTNIGPYEFESSSQSAPTDKIVEKYTEVINDYSDEKESGSVEESELLTNEQAPAPPKTNKTPGNKTEKIKTEKPHKPNKNKFVVADLLKLGSLGIKGLSQLAPVLEKMTGGFMKRQDNINKTTTSTTVKPETKLTQYSVNKRIDSDIDTKYNNFPIYIPVDDMDVSESQLTYKNVTLHQNLAWAAEHKHPKAHILPNKMIHESPLLNGGIPISPGEIITANSDVIVGKPAVGGPLTLAASGIRLQNPVNPPPLDSFVSANEQDYSVQELPNDSPSSSSMKVDDSFDLRPPELPKPKLKPNRNIPKPSTSPKYYESNNQAHYSQQNPKMSSRPHPSSRPNDHLMKTEQMKTTAMLGNHGRPAFLDYIPSFDQPNKSSQSSLHNSRPYSEPKEEPEIPDNSPSSSEIINTRIKVEPNNKPFLVDIQPSRVANVLIPHGSSTALVFAGSSEPHKTGDYVDDPLPYPEPGYFGSFSIDAPQMTNVHNVPPNNKPMQNKPNVPPPLEPYTSQSQNKESGVYRYEQVQKWKDMKRPTDFNKLPPPTSNQETHLHIGPKITVYNPDVYKPGTNGKFEKYNQKYHGKDGKDIIDKEYENYLAVPPPPPPKKKPIHEHFNQKPVVHTKPIQDMKVFLNIQHPVPKQPNVINKDKLPTKVTSEIYYAAQTPNVHSPTYTIHIPNTPISSQNNYYNQVTSNANQNKVQSQIQTHNRNPEQGSFTVVSSPNIGSKPGLVSDANDNANTYTVTLNTATNVANNVGDKGQIIGSSVPVSVGISNNENTDIPIGTNFAIRVEDGSSSFDYSVPIQGNRSPPMVYDSHGQANPNIYVGDNRWNTSSTNSISKTENSNNVIPDLPSSTPKYQDKHYLIESKPSTVSSTNSHANFPMINDISTPSNEIVKPVTEDVDDVKPEQKRPAKLIPNIPSNSHGWYSSVPINDFESINQVKELTTRKAIPLLYEYQHDSLPDFGQKIASVGKPPNEYYSENQPEVTETPKPFAKPIENETPAQENQNFNKNKFNINYLPHNLGSIRQPVYDIPVRDNSDETTTQKVNDQRKPIYEDAHEIYDGEDVNDDTDSEVSMESMHEPVISTSDEHDNKHEESKSSTESALSQDQLLEKDSKNEVKGTNVQFVDFNPGTQTEKPFNAESYNRTNNFQSNTIKPIEDHNSHMRPRPFTINTATTLDHQLHQPHWQINQLMENVTNGSYEENLELNIGEEMSTVTTRKPAATQIIPNRHAEFDNKYKRPQRPVFSLHSNNINESKNIITSTVHLKDKKPLTVINESNDISSTLPTFTISAPNFDLNRSESEIIDLSPPPPTMDYNFVPTNTDETIMGMSPPPPGNSMRPPQPTRSPATPRPNRTPPPYRNKPPRTTSPRIPTQRPTRKPITRDEISTYRPNYDILNNLKRPYYNRDQPSSQLLPPPRDMPSRVNPINDVAPSATVKPSAPNIVFPTPVSSGWLTSSGIEFSSKFDFGPTSVQFPVSSPSSEKLPEIPTTDKSFSYENEASSSTERADDVSSENPLIANRDSIPNENTEISTKVQTSSEESPIDDTDISKSSQEDNTTDKMKVVPLWNKNRTRKPYPGRDEDKKSSANKYKVSSKPSPVIRPTRTLTRPDLYPTRNVNTRKVIRPSPTRLPAIVRPSVIESSESSIDDEQIQPTEVLKDEVIMSESPTMLLPEKHPINEKTPSLENSIIYSESEVIPVVKPTHHGGNEVKIVDEIMPTKTEFKTTVITLTKTLSEPPQIVSSIGYVNLTHTLTVTHTKTSLVSQSEGAITQTLIMTNTHTSTLVDVITEIRTQVQPTTIIETVTKLISISQIEPTPVKAVPAKTKIALDDVTMSSEERDNFIIRDSETTENIQKIQQDSEGDNDSFFVVLNKSQNGGQAPPVSSNDVDTGEYDGITRNEQVNSNGVSQVLFGEILLAGTPYLETNVINHNGVGYGKECQPDCKASRNERCQRIDGMMKCVCRPGFARMFPDRPCKPTYTYSVKMALSSQGKEHLQFHENLADNSSNQYHSLALATHEGINRMVMQSDLRDVYHGVHITGFQPVELKKEGGEAYQGVMNDFYVQLSDNAHESRLKEVIEKYLRNNNYSLGGTDVFAASELMDRLNVSDFDECVSGQFHDCSEHAQCFNLRGTYTCSCLEGFADLSVNPLYPGRICSAEPVGCERCNYHGACYSRDDRRVLCECFQWYAGSSCHINLKVVLISLVTIGAFLTVILVICAVVACSKRPRPPPRSIVACIQGMPGLHQVRTC
ncbi:hypothetical protein JYU34_019951 [Plutella xylostella]|uniref:Uncharacterized protein n=1 Tax=Plutella xylostella TaxID=51655 RepID=A0ABQ7PVM7_PLUXY|nr:hypothetical protein JYU34_019951 [Plutella xylostella]